jgi:hypothetical protein
VLHDLGVRWVVIDRYQMPVATGNATRDYTTNAAAQIFGSQPPIYQDDRISAYEVNPPSERAPFLILGQGWSPFDSQRGSRSFQDAAVVIVRAPEDGPAWLRVALAPVSAPLSGEQANGETTLPLDLRAGENTVVLRSQQPGQRVEVVRLGLVSSD